MLSAERTAPKTVRESCPAGQPPASGLAWPGMSAPAPPPLRRMRHAPHTLAVRPCGVLFTTSQTELARCQVDAPAEGTQAARPGLTPRASTSRRNPRGEPRRRRPSAPALCPGPPSFYADVVCCPPRRLLFLAVAQPVSPSASCLTRGLGHIPFSRRGPGWGRHQARRAGLGHAVQSTRDPGASEWGWRWL